MDRRNDIIEDHRPWGWFRRYSYNEPSTVKVIGVAPGGSLSEQRHHDRDELWVVIDGGVLVQVGEEVTEGDPGAEFFIPRGTVHRLSNPGEVTTRVLEVAFGTFDEDDIERLSDQYGRVPDQTEIP